MQIGVLGPLEVRHDGEAVEVRGARLRALLARLALDSGRPVPVDVLAAALWEEQDEPAEVANAVQTLVSRLRRALPVPGVLESSPAGYRLTVDPDDVDALRFRALARRASDLDRAGDAAAQHTRGQARALWRGAALVDVLEAPFAPAEAAALEAARVTLTEEWIRGEVGAGRAREVLAEAQTLAEDHPLRESAAALLVRSLDGAGRPAEALAAYEQVRQRLSDALGVDPSAELRDLHLALLRGDSKPAAPPAPPADPPPAGGVLPSSVTSFFGRERDVARLRELLADDRLVTLIGVGGAGKTRLALETARSLAQDLPCWFVELAPVSDPDEIAQAVLDTLDARGLLLLDRAPAGTTRDATARVVEALSGGPVLLVLDNCEHVVDEAAAFVEELLRACPELRVLATSREALALTGEVVHGVHPLPRPEPGDSLAAAAGTYSVQLFVDRARAASPGFVLDDATLAPVVEVCRRLDGLPLAIELAAARLRTMTVEQLASRLDDRFRLLTGATRTTIARHRTLRAVVEWSWELLSDDERDVADVLAVFPPGADAAAVAAVLGGPGRPTARIEELLGQLVDKSIVVLTVVGGEPRYRMLETLREFGGDRLAAAGRLTEARRAHASYFRDLAERLEPVLRTADQLAAFATYDRERDNLVAALRFSVDDGDTDTATRLAAAMGWYWLVHDSNAEAAAWFGTVIAMPAGAGPVDPYARAFVQGLHAASAVAGDQVAWNDKARIRELLASAPDVDPTGGHPLLVFLPAVRRWLDTDTGFLEALGADLADKDVWTRAIVLVMRAYAAENAGDVDSQLRDAEAGLALFTEVGDRWGRTTALQSIANARLVTDDLDGATHALVTALRLARELDSDLADVVLLLVRLAGVRARRGDLDGAQELLDRAEETSTRGLWRESQALVATCRSWLLLSRGDLAGARAAHDEAVHLVAARTATPPQLQAGLLATGIDIDLAEGVRDGIRERLAAAYATARSTRDLPVVAAVATAAAEWCAATDEPTTGATVLGLAARLRGGADSTDPLIAHLTARLREAAGDERFEEAYAAGAALSRDDALARLEELVGGEGVVEA